MKHYLKPVAAVVTLALAAASAHAATLPAYSTTVPSTGNEVFLAVFDTNTTGGSDTHAGYTDLINLTSMYSDLTAAGAALTTPGASPWLSGVANPTGAAGTVYQLNLGTVSNWSSIFTAGQTGTSYMIVAENNAGQINNAIETTNALGSSWAYSGLANNATAIKNEIANWNGATPTSSPLLSKSAADTYSAQNTSTLDSGTLSSSSTGNNFSGAVGSALGFYNVLAPTSRGGSPSVNNYSYNGAQGFWFLSSTGDLTWNLIESSGTTVPLPAAIWLLASGLAGLGAIGRRRLAVA